MQELQARPQGKLPASRLLDLAVACLRLATEVEGSAVGKHIARPLIRSSTGGGANYEEAGSAESAADFAPKVAIAAKEVSETVYWLKVVDRARLSAARDRVHWMEEGRELVAILTASARTAKARLDGPTKEGRPSPADVTR